jgi:2'-5' RNA ligase
MSRPFSEGIGSPINIDTGRSGRIGRLPAPTMGSPSTSQDVTASRLMQQTMGRKIGEPIPEDSLDPLGEEIIKDDAVLRYVVRGLVNEPAEDKKSLGLFIPVPQEIVRQIEKQFPVIKSVALKDDSPPHVTLLYIGNVTGNIRRIKEIISGVALQHAPFRIHLRGTDYFDNPNQTVLYVHALSPGLDELHYDMRQAMLNAGYQIEQADFNDYIAHMTLQYLPPETRIQHMCMEFSWMVDRFEFWGDGSPVMFRLGEVTPITESSDIIDEDEETEEDTTVEVSAVGAVSGVTLPLGKKSATGAAPSWPHLARSFGNAKLAHSA